MKNSLIIIIIKLFFFTCLNAESLNIKSSNITIDKKTKISIFKDQVQAKDEKGNIFKTDYAEYDKKLGFIQSKGKTTVITSEGFTVNGEDIKFDNSNKLIKSNSPATVRDLDNNNIYLESFEYSIKNNFFKSSGKIKVIDMNQNIYNFSQIFIDEKKREIVGSDIKAFLNQPSLKPNNKNKPRVFANTINIKNQKTSFTKSIFTLCDYRKNDKCPPWVLQAGSMKHDRKAKTIFYDNAVIKIYDIPIFYLPKLSHPDPTVDRRSGFLPPSFSDTKNLGSGISIPYYWARSMDRDFTLTSKLFSTEHPLFLGEYRHAFNNANLIMDFGYTKGYKTTSLTKKKGDKSHFFAKFIKNFEGESESENNLELTLQEVSNDKYLKLYRINSDTIDYETDTLENTVDFTHYKDDLFLGLKASRYETLKESYNDKYEYILPDVILSKNLLSSNKFGNVDFQSNLKAHNYDTNKTTKFLVNDIDWKFKKSFLPKIFDGNILAKIKNVNYEAKNTSKHKQDTTSEVFGAIGYLTEFNLYKKTDDNSDHQLTPKLLLRHAPSHMKKETGSIRLDSKNIFNLDRMGINDNLEAGNSATIGFDYNIDNYDSEISISYGQVLSDRNREHMPFSSSLNKKLSDGVGSINYKNDNKFEINYNYALDNNFKDLNYNEIGTKFETDLIKFDFNYLQEKQHVGNQEYFKTNIEFSRGDSAVLSASTKRNLVTNSAEYYNLSYEYLNDCLRAGLVFRREFYNDSELEPENSLMFKITLTPFGNINSPSFNK